MVFPKELPKLRLILGQRKPHIRKHYDGLWVAFYNYATGLGDTPKNAYIAVTTTNQQRWVNGR